MEEKQREKERVRDDLGIVLLGKVLSPENMAQAWKGVRANKGAAGVDGVSIEDFPEFIHQHWESIRSKLENGGYQPSPVRRVLIPKDKGKFRTLGIPTVLDRVIQQAIAQVLGALYDPTFSVNTAMGFDPIAVLIKPSNRCARCQWRKVNEEPTATLSIATWKPSSTP